MRRPQGALLVIPLSPRRLVLPGVLLAGVAALDLLCSRKYRPVEISNGAKPSGWIR